MPLKQRDELIFEARELGARIDAPPQMFAAMDQPNDFASPFIEIDAFYHYVVREHGHELSRRSTLDSDELLYWVFEDLTFGMASKFELEHRAEWQDFRRILFAQQLDLLKRVKPEWRIRCADRLNSILAENPFLDDGPTRIA